MTIGYPLLDVCCQNPQFRNGTDICKRMQKIQPVQKNASITKNDKVVGQELALAAPKVSRLKNDKSIVGMTIGHPLLDVCVSTLSSETELTFAKECKQFQPVQKNAPVL